MVEVFRNLSQQRCNILLEDCIEYNNVKEWMQLRLVFRTKSKAYNSGSLWEQISESIFKPSADRESNTQDAMVLRMDEKTFARWNTTVETTKPSKQHRGDLRVIIELTKRMNRWSNIPPNGTLFGRAVNQTKYRVVIAITADVPKDQVWRCHFIICNSLNSYK